MDVLNLTPMPNATFYRNQVEALSDLGVTCTTLTVPGEVDGKDPDANRSARDYLRFLPTVMRRSWGEFDLIHANYGLTAPHALAQLRLPVVLSLWGSDVFGQYGWLSRLCAPLADEVVVMSPEMREALPCEATVIPHGVDFELFRPMSREQARERTGWADDSRHVLFAYPKAREEKNFPRARRVATAVDERLDVPVELQALDGRVSHEEMPVYLNAADALLVTSTHEGSPNTVKEALACNLPVVSTDVGDVAQRLDGVDLSTVATTDEALVRALASILESPRRSNGRESIRDLSVEATARRLNQVYERVCRSGRRPADPAVVTE